ncbi:MAG: tRNA lysidine(34) synthetase TilS [Acidobacteriaceae bacterium]
MKKAQSKRNSRAEQPASLPVDTSLFAPGDRVCVAVSGGADSTALLRCLLDRREELGIVLNVLHVEHGLRGQASVQDAAFVAELAKRFDVPCEIVTVDTPQRMAEQKESVETAARALRYRAFRQVVEAGHADMVATAHTLDDQAETVLMKLLRGAWTEGLSGIHPVLRWGKREGKSGGNSEGNSGGMDRRKTPARGPRCVRPFLAVRRAEIEVYLRELGQSWREDETNQSVALTRNRIRHELLPLLRGYNPRIEQTLAHMAANARAEEEHWQAELDRVLTLLLLPGKPVRGGGRSVSTALGETVVAMEIARLKGLDAGLLRRVLRAAVERLGVELDFDATERLLGIVDPSAPGSAQAYSKQGKQNGKRLELPEGVRVERSARELQFERRLQVFDDPTKPEGRSRSRAAVQAVEYELPIPGSIDAPAFRSSFTASIVAEDGKGRAPESSADRFPAAQVRAWQPGDRVERMHSRGPKKVKEILNQMRVTGDERTLWPVVVWRGKIVWMRGVGVKPANAQGEESDGEAGNVDLGWVLEIRETPKLL